MHVYLRMCIVSFIYIYTYIRGYMYIHVYVHTYMYVCVRMYVHVFRYAFIVCKYSILLYMNVYECIQCADICAQFFRDYDLNIGQLSIQMTFWLLHCYLRLCHACNDYHLMIPSLFLLIYMYIDKYGSIHIYTRILCFIYIYVVFLIYIYAYVYTWTYAHAHVYMYMNKCLRMHMRFVHTCM